MGKRTILAMTLALILVSCTDASPQDDDADDETASTVATGPGRLAILDSSGNVVVMDPDGENRSPVTDDAGEGAVYMQPVWSPDASQLAWGQVTEDGFAVGIQRPGTDTRTVVETSNLPFYVSWSPDGRNLGILHNGTSGVDFRMVDVGEGTSLTVDSAAPFYFSWSPTGDRVVTHAGEDRVEAIRPDGGRLRLEPTSPTYLAPQWTPKGVFHVVGDDLVLEDDSGVRAPIATVPGFTMFVANRQGTRVAIQVTGGSSAVSVALSEAPAAPTGRVVVVDVATGSVEVASESLSVGFFWSPDGRSLLVMTPASDEIVPSVWTTSGTRTEFEGYRPPGAIVRDTLPFFPQYAQSVSFWSPGSTAFAFAGDVDGEQGIWVQELGVTDPTKVSDGIWVAWSGG